MMPSLVSRPVVLTTAGVFALLLQAWLASLEEMLVFGLPLFVLAVGGYRIAATLPADRAPPAAPAAVGLVRKALVILLLSLLVAGFVYIIWGRIHDSGFVGWLDAVQARHGGRYREKTSVVTAFCDLLIAYGLGMVAVLKIGGRA
jgi:hypothetical protein